MSSSTVTRFRTRAYEHLSAIEFLRSEECRDPRRTLQ